jgi:hypothetical protein
MNLEAKLFLAHSQYVLLLNWHVVSSPYDSV